MLFSVIVPIYNVEKYLKQCVDSILVQTYKDFELILVDDGSPDRCPEICDDLAKIDNRIVVIHKSNGGLSEARNAGIEVARGEYAVFVDSDDFYTSNKVLETVAAEIHSSGADVIQFNRKWYYEDLNTYVEKEDAFYVSCRDFKPSEVIKVLTKKKAICFSAYQNIVKISFLKKHDLYFTKGIKSEDIDWGFRLFSRLPQISLLPDSFYAYRVGREGSITSSIDYNHMVNYCDLLEKSLYMIKHGDKEVCSALMSHLLYHILISSALVYRVRLSKKEKKNIQYRLAQLCKNNMGKYNMDNRVKLAGIIYKIFGYHVMAFVLGTYLNYRGKGKHSFKTINEVKEKD